MSTHDDLELTASPTEPSVQVLETTMHIHELSIDRPSILAYLQNIPADKLEIALIHALEVGVTELAARRQRFRH